MRALGFSHFSVAVCVLAEASVVLVAGLIIGTLSATLAVMPDLARATRDIPWVSISLILGATVFIALATGFIVLTYALRSPMLLSLRSE